MVFARAQLEPRGLGAYVVESHPEHRLTRRTLSARLAAVATDARETSYPLERVVGNRRLLDRIAALHEGRLEAAP